MESCMSIKSPLSAQPRAGHEFATLGGGCFWCLEAVFEELEGVVDVESGYSGGHVPNPSYRQVCEGDTGHAEVVRIEFDPARISYREILEVFFAIHDPTTLNPPRKTHALNPFRSTGSDSWSRAVSPADPLHRSTRMRPEAYPAARGRSGDQFCRQFGQAKKSRGVRHGVRAGRRLQN